MDEQIKAFIAQQCEQQAVLLMGGLLRDLALARGENAALRARNAELERQVPKADDGAPHPEPSHPGQ